MYTDDNVITIRQHGIHQPQQRIATRATTHCLCLAVLADQSVGFDLGRRNWKRMREYWNDHKQCFGEGSIDDVELWASEDAMKSMILARQHWLTKHTSGFNAMGKNMLRRKEWTHSKCPRYAHTVEDSTHVIKCRGAGASLIWDQAIRELEHWMSGISTTSFEQFAQNWNPGTGAS